MTSPLSSGGGDGCLSNIPLLRRYIWWLYMVSSWRAHSSYGNDIYGKLCYSTLFGLLVHLLWPWRTSTLRCQDDFWWTKIMGCNPPQYWWLNFWVLSSMSVSHVWCYLSRLWLHVTFHRLWTPFIIEFMLEQIGLYHIS